MTSSPTEPQADPNLTVGLINSIGLRCHQSSTYRGFAPAQRGVAVPGWTGSGRRRAAATPEPRPYVRHIRQPGSPYRLGVLFLANSAVNNTSNGLRPGSAGRGPGRDGTGRGWCIMCPRRPDHDGFADQAWLTARSASTSDHEVCSFTPLVLRLGPSHVERVTGIEPALSAWESVPSGPARRPDCEAAGP